MSDMRSTSEVGFGRVCFLETIFFANGVAVGVLVSKIASKSPQQRFLGVVLLMVFFGVGVGGRWD